MRQRPENYLDAAIDHIHAVRRLHHSSDYVLAYYIAGLAVECAFLAFKFRADLNAIIDEKHDLTKLARNSGFLDLMPGKFKALNSALNNVVFRWQNSHRYRSKKDLSSYLKRQNLFRGIKGDVVKENSRIIMESALLLVSFGAEQWPRLRR